eukprot:403356044
MIGSSSVITDYFRPVKTISSGIQLKNDQDFGGEEPKPNLRQLSSRKYFFKCQPGNAVLMSDFRKQLDNRNTFNDQISPNQQSQQQESEVQINTSTLQNKTSQGYLNLGQHSILDQRLSSQQKLQHDLQDSQMIIEDEEYQNLNQDDIEYERFQDLWDQQDIDLHSYEKAKLSQSLKSDLIIGLGENSSEVKMKIDQNPYNMLSQGIIGIERDLLVSKNELQMREQGRLGLIQEVGSAAGMINSKYILFKDNDSDRKKPSTCKKVVIRQNCNKQNAFQDELLVFKPKTPRVRSASKSQVKQVVFSDIKDLNRGRRSQAHTPRIKSRNTSNSASKQSQHNYSQKLRSHSKQKSVSDMSIYNEKQLHHNKYNLRSRDENKNVTKSVKSFSNQSMNSSRKSIKLTFNKKIDSSKKAKKEDQIIQFQQKIQKQRHRAQSQIRNAQSSISQDGDKHQQIPDLISMYEKKLALQQNQNIIYQRAFQEVINKNEMLRGELQGLETQINNLREENKQLKGQNDQNDQAIRELTVLLTHYVPDLKSQLMDDHQARKTASEEDDQEISMEQNLIAPKPLPTVASLPQKQSTNINKQRHQAAERKKKSMSPDRIQKSKQLTSEKFIGKRKQSEQIEQKSQTFQQNKRQKRSKSRK